MKKITIIFIFLIVFAGGFLRLYNLAGAPPSLNWDEAAWGYNAYSVSQTLKDEYGKVLPVFTRSFDEYKSTLPMYLMVPTIKIFGLNETGVRLPSAIIGTLSIVLIYLLAKELFKDEKVALVSALVFSIESWAVHLSRVYYDANEAMFFLLLGFLLFLKSKSNIKLLPVSVFFFVISLYTYNSDKILVPLFLLILFFFNKSWILKIKEPVRRISLLLLVILVLPFIYLAFKGQTFARVTTTNIFSLWKDELSPKIFFFAWDILGRLWAYFSPLNLFIREPQEPATILAGNSIFNPFEFIPWVAGLYFVLNDIKKNKEFIVLMFLSVVPAMVTWNFFQPGRVMALFAVFSILIGLGIVRIFEKFYPFIKRVAYLSLIVFSLITAFYIFDSVNVYLPFRDNGNYQPGFKETVPAVMKYAERYEQVIIDTPQGQPYIFYLFYSAYDPNKYLKELDLKYIGTPRKHFDFGKFKFRKINWEEDKKLKNTLFVGDEKDFPDTKPLFLVKNRFGDTINELVGTN